jgi:hypothetical protein
VPGSFRLARHVPADSAGTAGDSYSHAAGLVEG